MKAGLGVAAAVAAVLVAGACAAGNAPGGAMDDADPVLGRDGADAVIDAADSPPDACVAQLGGERCNGVDDDCDGEIDEGFPGVGVECDVGTGACERTGFTVCDTDGLTVVCAGTPGSPTPELCGNTVDENCNEMLDDGLGLGTPCDGPADGDLCREGITVCGADGHPACDEPAEDDLEACNGMDDDCDGATDEGIPAGAPCDGNDADLCIEGSLICAGGAMVCSDNSGANGERCNEMDDNCDGAIDESWPTKGGACANGTGACSRPGTFVCNAAQNGVTCNAVQGSPGREFCGDGIDGDCSGGTDPTCPANDRPTGAIDVSAGGTFSVNLTYANDDTAGSCGEDGGRDVFYQITLPGPEVVYLDTFGANFDTVLSVRQGACSAAPTELACSDDECGSTRSQLARELGGGTWCIIAEQFHAATTTGGLSLKVVRGGRTGSQVPLGSSIQSGDTCAAGVGHVATGTCDDSSGKAAPDRAYWFAACPGSHAITAKTCGTTTNFDTVLYLRAGSAGAADLSCSDDSCSTSGTCDGDVNVASSISTSINGANLYWLIVNGFDAGTNCDRCGRYALTLTL